MQQIGTLITKVLAKRGLATEAKASHIVHASQQWLHGKLPALRTFVAVDKFQDGTLYITCSHSIAVQECYPLFADLQRFLEKECLFKGVTAVRLSRS